MARHAEMMLWGLATGWPSAERDGGLPMDGLPAPPRLSKAYARSRSAGTSGSDISPDPGRLQRSRRRLEPERGDATGAEVVPLVTGRAIERSPLRLDGSPAAGPRGRGGRPAADSAIQRSPMPVLMTYRPSSGAPSSGALQTRLSSIGSTPPRISARAARRGASLVGDCSPICRPSSPSSQ